MRTSPVVACAVVFVVTSMRPIFEIFARLR